MGQGGETKLIHLFIFALMNHAFIKAIKTIIMF